MTSFLHVLRALAFVLLLCVFTPQSVVAADEDTQTAGDDTTAASDEPKVDPFEVPTGTARELFLFIDRIKQMPPAERTREAVIAHRQKQAAAVLKAADQILAEKVSDGEAVRAIEEKFLWLSMLANIDPAAQKDVMELAQKLIKDPRPPVVKVAHFQLLLQGIMKSLRGEQPEAAVDQIFDFVEKHGLDQQVVALAAQVGNAFERAGSSIAAEIYTRLAAEMEKSEDPGIKERLPLVAGTARRLNLPGNFMELSGVTADGSEFDWKSYRGKFVLIDFWASWCGPCRAEIPNVKKNLEEYGSKGFAVVGINIDRTRAEYETYMEEAQLPWQNIMPDENGDSAMANYYAITGIPTVILVDREGKVVSLQARGPELGRLLEMHLGGDGEPGGAE